MVNVKVDEYILNFDGYYIEHNKSSLPKRAGIYCVYKCKYNKKENAVSDLFLLYIGESENINERHNENKHEHYDDFCSYLSDGEILCYSYALVSDDDERMQCEAALIYKMQPPINTQNKDDFLYEKTHIKTSGSNSGLSKDFIVGK